MNWPAERPPPPDTVRPLHTIVPVVYGDENGLIDHGKATPMCWEHGPECTVGVWAATLERVQKKQEERDS